MMTGLTANQRDGVTEHRREHLGDGQFERRRAAGQSRENATTEGAGNRAG
jgi:hypothetical protein